MGGKLDKKKCDLVSWDRACRLKSQGRLGIRYLGKRNEIFGAKIWWKLVSHKEEHWEKLWHTKYFQERKK